MGVNFQTYIYSSYASDNHTSQINKIYKLVHSIRINTEGISPTGSWQHTELFINVNKCPSSINSFEASFLWFGSKIQSLIGKNTIILYFFLLRIRKRITGMCGHMATLRSQGYKRGAKGTYWATRLHRARNHRATQRH